MPPPSIQATMLVADFVQEVGGKLYITRGAVIAEIRARLDELEGQP